MREVSAELEACFAKVFPEDWNMPLALLESMNYSLNAGGKRLRPLLVVAAGESLGGSREAAIRVAAAVEMVHTYSLIHDDLPAMDDDDLRRGKPTNHKVYGEAMAILAGDGLLTHAFYVVASLAKDGLLPADAALAIVSDLSEYAGPRGMVGGQVADMEGEQGITDLERLEYIHLHKTSDLIMFSLMAGGRTAGASAEQLEALRTFGRGVGLAFQIQDDILDLVGDESKLGKKTQSDVKMQKVTYPYFLGIEQSREEVRRLSAEAKAAVTGAGLLHTERLLAIADYLVDRDR
ncbi:polyprenyl synthetase family protein [Saccharibacillus sp. CPCC 101409]|uniref:polyprenyl synthetase family protein n=1 Tax=Saccharibacillus sp. CPCC 101409 TaxID=3058041 RepID=UPI002673B787|nr:farnesyl diphosphate synthase [Saccharibacillus sp. CPCC 101409]MDO3409539.1 polyprenyl synthetase family protein [Saccharibacillus sp. CPCC 101409]